MPRSNLAHSRVILDKRELSQVPVCAVFLGRMIYRRNAPPGPIFHVTNDQAMLCSEILKSHAAILAFA